MGDISEKRRWRRAVRFCAWFAAAIVVLVIAAALILPWFLDTPAIRAAIQRELSAAVHGEITWEELTVRILPAPRGVLRKVRLEIPAVASISADEASAYLRLWPLIRGRAEIASVAFVRPVIRVGIAPAAVVEQPAPEKDPAPDIFGLYRSAVRPIADAVRRFAPDMVLAIDDAEVELHAPGAPPIQLSKLSLQARTGIEGMDLDATAASPYWRRLKLTARLAFADLSASASLEVDEFKPQAWLDHYLEKAPVGVSLASVRLRAEARTDAMTSLGCDVEASTNSVGIAHAGQRLDVPHVEVKGTARVGAEETIISLSEVRLGGSRLRGGELSISARDGGISGHSDYDLDLTQGMDYARRLVPAPVREVLAWFHPVTGRAHGRVKLALGAPGWSVGVDVRKSDVAVQIRDYPGPVRLGRGSVEIDGHGVKLDRVALTLPAGEVLLSTLRHSFKDGATTGGGSFDLDVARWLELARRFTPREDRDAIQRATGRVNGKARFAFGRGDWKFDIDVPKSNLSLEIQNLPGPVRITGLSIAAGPTSMKINHAAVAMLDASAVFSVTFDEFDTGTRVRGAIAESAIGEQYLAWVWQLAGLPPDFEPAAPVRIVAPLVVWRLGGALEVQATAQFDAGPSVAVDIGWASGALDIRRVAIKDARSDAQLALRAKGGLLEGHYAGDLHGASVAVVLKRANVPSGFVAGDLRFTIDREHLQRTSASGHLKGETLDLAALIGRPLRIERIDLAADDTGLRVHEAALSWAGQSATLRGDLSRSEHGPVIDAQIDSPGINLDALLPPEPETVADVRSKPGVAGEDAASRLWPLPVTGRVAVRSDFVQRGRHRIAPVVATLSLEARRAHLDVEQARLCGISLPLTIEVTPQGYSASARIAARAQQLKQTAHCLSEERVLISGLYDLDADISTQGRPAEFLQNLKGAVRADMRDGNVMKFAFLGNILSMRNVASLMTTDGPKVDAEGFPYRKLIVNGRFGSGRFNVEEGAFHSDALGLAVNGWIALDKPESRLTVLVAPFSRLDEMVRKVPLVGYIIGGAFTSVPVGVSGDIRDPLVVPLGPEAVGSEVLGIFERTLKLPVKLITPSDTK